MKFSYLFMLQKLIRIIFFKKRDRVILEVYVYEKNYVEDVQRRKIIGVKLDLC